MQMSSAERAPWVAVASKVPVITGLFWGIKLLTTAMGEAASDFGVHLNAPVAVGLAFVALVAALLIQFSLKRFNAWAYWFVVAMIAVFGTMAADIIHKAGVPHPVTTAAFGLLLAIVFFCWRASEGTLSIHSIFTRRREAFYWTTVFVSFAFGTAAGDWTAHNLGLGNFVSGLVFLVLFLAPALGYWKFRLNDIFAFWFSYVMTRPLGASFADWIDGKPAHGDLGFSRGYLAVILTVVIVCLVGYSARALRDKAEGQAFSDGKVSRTARPG